MAPIWLFITNFQRYTLNGRTSVRALFTRTKWLKLWNACSDSQIRLNAREKRLSFEFDTINGIYKRFILIRKNVRNFSRQFFPPIWDTARQLSVCQKPFLWNLQSISFSCKIISFSKCETCFLFIAFAYANSHWLMVATDWDDVF